MSSIRRFLLPRRGRIEGLALPVGCLLLAARSSYGSGLELQQPAWQTWWIWALVALIAILVAFFGGTVLIRRDARRRAELKAEIAVRTAELEHERQEVRKKNGQLLITDKIIQLINAELDFDSLLQSILEGISFLEAARCALALVYDKSGEVYEVKAHVLWPELPEEVPPLTRDEIERGLLAPAEAVAEGVHIGRHGGRPPASEKLGSVPPSYLVMTVELAGEAAGFLVFSEAPEVFHEEREAVHETEGFEAVMNLKSHATSAFIKGRLMEELQALNDTKDELMGLAAHDLRSPLAGMMGAIELFLQILEDPEIDRGLWRELLESMRMSTDHMHTLINGLVDMTAIETGHVHLEVDRQRLRDVLREHELLQLHAAEKKRIDFQIDHATADHEVLADRVRVGEVIDNLLSNAVKYTPPGGKVRVYCEARNGEVITHVEDTGLGLEEDEIDTAFTGGKLSARPTAGETSIGLGLAISKKLVELHGGKIWVVSEKNKGSTFSFSLPRARTRF